MKEFMLGTNYWASHAGIEMWRNWNEDVIRHDFEILSSHGAKYLRVFPVWRDFQPVNPLFDGQGQLREYRVNDDKLPENKYYLDETMLSRFERFCDIAEEYGMKFIVGILTGWMSGRLFIPPALYGKNLFTDPTSLMLELKYIEGFVRRVKNKSAVYSWDLGNECNCMSKVDSHEAAEAWTGIIANAIRANDPTREIVSGMHGISCEGNWRISGQANYTDVLTTHPYPYFVPHCTMDTYSSMRTLLHATCETKYYSDLGHKPCLVEEIGNLGPMMCDDEVAASFLKVNMFSNWAHGSPGVLWWCANDQNMLETPPYCWNMCEVELGMIDSKRNPKPVLREMKSFSDWVNNLDFELPPAAEDAVCLLTMGQDNWG
ncbi:MAG: cellulase family glycosylhydrolase, partial [Clostridia bacterium]|nr:cellulase family glycosylhydrolase [Clostridia bacterium]